MQPIQRPRRNRKSAPVRDFHRETWLAPQHFMYPLFIHEGGEDIPITSMPGCSRLCPSGLWREVESSLEVVVSSFVLFPATPDHLKTPAAEEAYNPEGLVQRTLRTLKEKFPEAVLVTDVALDPYSSEGHDGLVSADGHHYPTAVRQLEMAITYVAYRLHRLGLALRPRERTKTNRI